MKEKILSNWHAIRVMYLFIGVGICVYSIVNREWTGLLPGAYFASMAIFHFGCATGGCSIPSQKRGRTINETTEPHFEEIK